MSPANLSFQCPSSVKDGTPQAQKKNVFEKLGSTPKTFSLAQRPHFQENRTELEEKTAGVEKLKQKN